DGIVGTTAPGQPAAPYDPYGLKPLPTVEDPQRPTPRYDPYEFSKRLQDLASRPMVVQVQRHGAAESDPPVLVLVPPAYHYTLGVRMRVGRVTAVRDGSPAEKAGVQPDDVLQQVEATDAAGNKVRFVTERGKNVPADVTERDLDPLRLAYERGRLAAARPDLKVPLTATREKNHKADNVETTRDVRWDDTYRYSQELPSGLRSPTSLPCLGIAFLVEPVVQGVEPDSPAARAGLQ